MMHALAAPGRRVISSVACRRVRPPQPPTDGRSRSEAPMIRVMIVHDYPFMRFGLRELLNAEDDIEVVAACGDEEAVELAEQVEPDIVVTDLRVPSLGWANTIRQILRRHPAARVLVLTTTPRGPLAARATAAGAQAVLADDACLPRLIAAIRA